MNHSELIEHDARIGGIWPLINVCPPSTTFLSGVEYKKLPEALKPLVKGWSDDEIEQLFEGDDHETAEAWAMLVEAAERHGMNGFLCVVEVPVYSKWADNSLSYSWGHYTLELLYGETVDEVLEAAKAYAIKRNEEAKRVPTKVKA
jgi:hypothetical protein